MIEFWLIVHGVAVIVLVLCIVLRLVEYSIVVGLGIIFIVM